MRRLSFLLFLCAAFVLSGIPYINSVLGWFETLFHESSHGLMAILTGGRVSRLDLNLDGSGLTWFYGGIGPLVSFSGYAGALIWGGLLYITASSSSRKITNIVIYALLGAGIAETFFWLSWNPITLGVMFTLLAPLCLLLYYETAWGAKRFLQMIGAYVLVSGMRAPTYVLADGGAHNDAGALRSILLLPEWFWVALWCLLGIGVIICVYQFERHADRKLSVLHRPLPSLR
jgi:Peptidase M50B-like